MKHDARIAPRESIDDGGYEGRGQSGDRSDSNFASRRIRKKLDVLYSATQIIEHGHSAIKQRATVLGRLNPLAVAVEQAYAECRLQFRNRSRNGGLRGVETLRCLAHAAGLRHGHQDVQVLQLHVASDTVLYLHDVTHSRADMRPSDNNIFHEWVGRILSSHSRWAIGRQARATDEGSE